MTAVGLDAQQGLGGATEATTSLTDQMKSTNTAIHKEAENAPFMKALLGDQLTDTQYLQYLVDMGEVFRGIEEFLDKSDAEFLKIYFRSDAIKKDCEGIPGKTPQPSEAATKYYAHLKTLKGDSRILAHAYVQYLAILFGGQMQKKHVPVTAFYEFNDVTTADYTRKSMSLVKHFKEWLNGKPFPPHIRDAIIAESSTAFAMTKDILFSYDLTDPAKAAAAREVKDADREFEANLVKASVDGTDS